MNLWSCLSAGRSRSQTRRETSGQNRQKHTEELRAGTRRCPQRGIGFLLFVCVVAIAGARAPCADSLPDPYRHSEEPIIGPAAVPVMEQVFWVQLNVPPEVRTKVTAPPGVILLDRTKPGKTRQRTRLYFRSDRGIERGTIRIEISDRAGASVPLRVLTYRQDIEEKIKAVPGVDPSVRKQGRSYYTKEIIALAKENLKKFPELGRQLGTPTRYEDMTDEELFASLPSWNVPRQCYSNWPCPHCGEAIYQHNGYYPWRRNPAYPFRGQCPLCDKRFPSNDFANDDFTSGEFPDDGWGWDPGSGNRQDFAGWVAHYNHHILWQVFGPEVHRLALRYLLQDDEQAAHKVGVLLSRMAYVYPGMNTRWQQVRTSYLRPGRLLLDGSWERNQILVPVCRAYDAVFGYLDQDTRLVQFLQTKDPVVIHQAEVFRNVNVIRAGHAVTTPGAVKLRQPPGFLQHVQNSLSFLC